ncbi:MAG TPA: hypothetical protein VN666_15450, partial [Nitrospira sp.]|nr:hypothetical protein [Nitrospira sp.]
CDTPQLAAGSFIIGSDATRPLAISPPPSSKQRRLSRNPVSTKSGEDHPVAFYAAIFVCVDIAYNVFEREVFAQAEATKISERAQRMARRRSLTVLGIFASAMLVALVAPRFGFGLVCSALILHLRPEAPGIFGGWRMSKRLTEVLKRIPG